MCTVYLSLSWAGRLSLRSPFCKGSILTRIGVLIQVLLFSGNVPADWFLPCRLVPALRLFPRFALALEKGISGQTIFTEFFNNTSHIGTSPAHTVCVRAPSLLLVTTLCFSQKRPNFKNSISSYLQSLLFPCLNILHS